MNAVYHVVEELRAARKQHDDMHSLHEGYAVIKEELDEFWDEVRAQSPNLDACRKELIQVAAMALRCIADCIDTHRHADEEADELAEQQRLAGG